LLEIDDEKGRAVAVDRPHDFSFSGSVPDDEIMV
jgi:hypothetical protein